MRNQSSEKVDEIDIVQGNEENFKRIFSKELDIAIANEKKLKTNIFRLNANIQM